MPVSEYRTLIEQAINLGNLHRGGKFELVDQTEKRKDFLREIEFFKAQGRLN